MADLKVHFLHPTDGRIVTVTLDDTMTADEAVNHLIANDFVMPHEEGYSLAIKGKGQIRPNQQFADAGLREEDTVRIIPSTSAGGRVRDDRLHHGHQAGRDIEIIDRDRSSGALPVDAHGNARHSIPGLDKGSIGSFSIEDVRNSPEALIMIVHLYDDLQLRFDRLSTDFVRERDRSRDRFVAALLLLVSQAVLSIGASLLPTEPSNAIPVLVAGGLQGLLALYLTFRKPRS
jgi:hypothetical protein